MNIFLNIMDFIIAFAAIIPTLCRYREILKKLQDLISFGEHFHTNLRTSLHSTIRFVVFFNCESARSENDTFFRGELMSFIVYVDNV